MSTNVGTAESFTTGNMKPDAGEQIDALWGRNAASNDAFMYYREIPMSLSKPSSSPWNFVFTKRASHNGLKVLALTLGSVGVGTINYLVYPPTGTVAASGAGASLTTSKTYTTTGWTYERTDIDISSLGTGTIFTLSVDETTHPGLIGVAAWQIHGSAATY